MNMRSYDTLVLNAMKEQRVGQRGAASAELAAAQTILNTDIDVLNYALTLEHLESAFYDLLSQYTFGEDPFGASITERLQLAGQQEAIHVDILTQVITDLGGEPVAAAEYDFGITDADSFLATGQTLETIGVSAYDGAAQFLESPDLLTAAGTIVAVEARHSAYLNLLVGLLPFPQAFENVMTPEEVLDAAGPFIVSGS